MAYLVVLIVNNAPHNKGDVISWRPEGAHIDSFGTKMLAHPWFRVVHCPDMLDAEAEALTSAEPGDRKVDPTVTYRAFTLDLPDVAKNPDKSTPEDLVMNKVQVQAAVRRKRP
jgi:hypothetical protein